MVVLDLPSTTFDRPYLGFGSSLAQLPSCTCAGCETPFGAPFRLISTLVWSPSGVSFAVPLSPDLFCAPILTETLFAPLPDFLSILSPDWANAAPPANRPAMRMDNRRSFIGISSG